MNKTFPFFKAMADSLAAPPEWRPRTSEWFAVEAILGTHVNAALAGVETPEEAITKAAREIEQHMRRPATIAEVGARGLLAPGPLPARVMRHWTPYLLVAPPVVLLASLVIYPLLYNVSLSLRSYRTGEFVGLHNFARALDDPQFFASLRATAVYVSGTLVVEILLGLALALLVHRTIRSGWARTLVYLLFLIPMVTPPVAAGVIARLIYSPTYGVLNVLLQRVGLIHTDVLWLAQPFTAMLAVISVDVWQWMPFVFLVCFAGLQAVPVDTAEAARVDGADGWRLFRHIEYPYLRSLLLLVMVFRFTDTFRVFDHVQVLTGGGPGATTEFLSLYLYLIAFKFFNLSYAAALSLFVLFVTSAAFSVLTRYLGREAGE